MLGLLEHPYLFIIPCSDHQEAILSAWEDLIWDNGRMRRAMPLRLRT